MLSGNLIPTGLGRRRRCRRSSTAKDRFRTQRPFCFARGNRSSCPIADLAGRGLQLHGGCGYLAEYGQERIVRGLRVHQILEVTSEIMRLIVARKLVERVQ
jgi:alkylation response protein AidB-like acyl-CoA dehydrogenase